MLPQPTIQQSEPTITITVSEYNKIVDRANITEQTISKFYREYAQKLEHELAEMKAREQNKGKKPTHDDIFGWIMNIRWTFGHDKYLPSPFRFIPKILSKLRE